MTAQRVHGGLWRSARRSTAAGLGRARGSIGIGLGEPLDHEHDSIVDRMTEGVRGWGLCTVGFAERVGPVGRACVAVVTRFHLLGRPESTAAWCCLSAASPPTATHAPRQQGGSRHTHTPNGTYRAHMDGPTLILQVRNSTSSGMRAPKNLASPSRVARGSGGRRTHVSTSRRHRAAPTRHARQSTRRPHCGRAERRHCRCATGRPARSAR